MSTLDMSLDDMIKSRRSNERGRGQGRARRGGRGSRGSFRGARTSAAPLRAPLGMNARSSAFKIAKSFRRVNNLPWKNGLFEESLKASGLETGTKLYVSNLDRGVTNLDIRELFSEIGELMRYGIHYDKNGQPSGSAEVLFARRSDAFQALERYNNVQLDGKPMKIEIVGVNDVIPFTAHVNVVGRANGGRAVVMLPGPGRARGGSARSRVGPTAVGRGAGQRFGGTSRGGFGRGGGRGHGRQGRGGSRGGKRPVKKSADDLDNELENYHAEAMQT